MRVAEESPDECPYGHRLGPNECLVGWETCGCAEGGGHRTYYCRECGAVIYRPPCAGAQPRQDRWGH